MTSLLCNETGSKDSIDYLVDAFMVANKDIAPEEPYLVAYLPKPFAILSLMGSYILLRETLTDQHSRKATSPTRLLLSMSIADIWFTVPLLWGTWMAPADMESEYILGNVGNQGTCNFQAWMVTMGLLASPLFNTTYALFCLFMVRYNWKDFQLHKLEIPVHAAIWIFAFATATFPIFLGLYNSQYLREFSRCCMYSYKY